MPCDRTVWPESPIINCDGTLYAGREMGLHGDNSNVRPPALEANVQAAVSTIPVDGITTVGVAFIGQSTAKAAYNVLFSMPAFQAAKRRNIVVVNGAEGSYNMEKWTEIPTWSIGLAQRVAAKKDPKTGLSLTMSQIRSLVLVNTFKKDAEDHPTDINARFAAYTIRMAAFRSLATQYLPNLSVIYAAGLHPLYNTGYEPGIGYESSLAFRDDEMLLNNPPLLMPWYAWSKGAEPNANGLSWTCPTDYQPDGIHYSASGATKYANLILNTLKTDSTTGWFRI